MQSTMLQAATLVRAAQPLRVCALYPGFAQTSLVLLASGEKALQSQLLNPGAIKKTQAFYRKHGGRAIVLARFVPIIRTFAPFVAGIGSMPYREFAAFNVGGAGVWVSLFCGAGFLFGNMPWVQSNFTLLILGIVAISVLPVFYEVWQARREQTPLSPGSGDA